MALVESHWTYASWLLSTSNHPESHYSQCNPDPSTFLTFNRLSSHLSNKLCSPEPYSTILTPTEYTIAVVSLLTNNSSHTPVNSDGGFCGSSDPSLHNGHNHLLSSYRQPYIMMKVGSLNKNQHLSSLTNGTDTARPFRFKFQSEQQGTILSSHLSDHSLRQYEPIYITYDNILEKQLMNSTVV